MQVLPVDKARAFISFWLFSQCILDRYWDSLSLPSLTGWLLAHKELIRPLTGPAFSPAGWSRHAPHKNSMPLKWESLFSHWPPDYWRGATGLHGTSSTSHQRLMRFPHPTTTSPALVQSTVLLVGITLSPSFKCIYFINLKRLDSQVISNNRGL